MIRKANTVDCWVIDGDSHFTSWIEQQGRLDHDQSILSVILKYIPKSGVVIDCGAYIGTLTYPFINQVGPEGTVYAIEPNPIAFEALERNCPSAMCLNVGLWDSLRKGKLVPPTDSNFGATSIDPSAAGDVDLVCLDSLGIPRVDFYKLDCEGCECQALAGSRKTIERCKPIMLVEVNDGCLKAHNRSGKELMLMIVDMGYTIRNVYGEQPMDGPQFDILAFPKTQS